MTSRERMLATIRGEKADHVPLYAWVFGYAPPERLRWRRNGHQVRHWYTGRMEHIHTLSEPWDVYDDMRRVEAWLSDGIDDMLDVSVPWGRSDRVHWEDSVLPVGACDERYPVLVREYQTPNGSLRHATRWITEEVEPGWMIQPDHVPLIEDLNVSRAVQHLISTPEDIPKVSWLFCSPGATESEWLRDRMEVLAPFARDHGVMVQAWSAFGADAAVWFAGIENAVMLCMEHPEAFEELLDLIHEVDMARTRLALEHEIDLVVQRGWYSSTDFWSPHLFRQHFKPRIAELAALVHEKGKLFGYVMTTGVMMLAPDLADAGVDLLYYVDPVQDHLDLAEAASRFHGRLAVAGGVNSGVTLARGSAHEIAEAVRQALSAFGNDGGFILSPVDALFPDTPPSSVETMIEAWRRFNRI